MEKLLMLCCIFTATTAIFFPSLYLPNNRQSMTNVCIYSVNPARYQPKCFYCPTSAYTNALRTCFNAAGMPSNISYVQASCLEQNCAISRGRRSLEESQHQIDVDRHLNNGVELHQLDDPSLKSSSPSQVVNQPRYEIKETVEAFASNDYEDFEDDASNSDIGDTDSR